MNRYVIAVVNGWMDVDRPGVSLPPTEWTRPCEKCRTSGYLDYPDRKHGSCDGEGTITTPLTCQTCSGVGHLGPATHSPPKDYGRACPACHNGHPIIEWEGQRLAIEAVPIVRPQHQRTEELVIKQMADGAFLCQSGERTRIDLPDAKPGDYAIVGTEVPNA